MDLDAMRFDLAPEDEQLNSLSERAAGNFTPAGRILEIQRKVDAERTSLLALYRHTLESSSKQVLWEQASYLLDDVEQVFLGSARNTKRTPDALARWLSHAEFTLEFAIHRRKRLEAEAAYSLPIPERRNTTLSPPTPTHFSTRAGKAYIHRAIRWSLFMVRLAMAPISEAFSRVLRP